MFWEMLSNLFFIFFNKCNKIIVFFITCFKMYTILVKFVNFIIVKFISLTSDTFKKNHFTNILFINNLCIIYDVATSSGLCLFIVCVIISKLFLFYILYLFYQVIIYCRYYLAYVLYDCYRKYIKKLWFYEILFRHTTIFDDISDKIRSFYLDRHALYYELNYQIRCVYLSRHVLFYDINYKPKTLFLHSFCWFIFVSIIMLIFYFWNMFVVCFLFFIISNYIYLIFLLDYLFAVNYRVKELIEEQSILEVKDSNSNISNNWHFLLKEDDEILTLMIYFIQRFCFGYILTVTCINTWLFYIVLTWTYFLDFNTLTEFFIVGWAVILNHVSSIDIALFYNMATSIKFKIINFLGVDVIIGQENASFFEIYVIEHSGFLFFGFMVLFIGYIIQKIKNFKVCFLKS